MVFEAFLKCLEIIECLGRRQFVVFVPHGDVVARPELDPNSQHETKRKEEGPEVRRNSSLFETLPESLSAPHEILSLELGWPGESKGEKPVEAPSSPPSDQSCLRLIGEQGEFTSDIVTQHPEPFKQCDTVRPDEAKSLGPAEKMNFHKRNTSLAPFGLYDKAIYYLFVKSNFYALQDALSANARVG